MQDLGKALAEAANNGKLIELEDAGQIWAAFCVKNFCGDLLKKGLRISRAIVDFEMELQQKENAK